MFKREPLASHYNYKTKHLPYFLSKSVSSSQFNIAGKETCIGWENAIRFKWLVHQTTSFLRLRLDNIEIVLDQHSPGTPKHICGVENCHVHVIGCFNTSIPGERWKACPMVTIREIIWKVNMWRWLGRRWWQRWARWRWSQRSWWWRWQQESTLLLVPPSPAPL